MVASAHYLATEAGRQALADGGNAFDAAIATSLALSVVEAAGSGLGGMAIVTAVAARGVPFVLAGPCRAPRGATPQAVAQSKRYTSHRAVATPAYVTVLEALQAGYATLPLSRLIEPAISLARAGFPLTPLQTELIARYRPSLRRFNAAELFLTPTGETPSPGALLAQPELAATLEQLGRRGLRDFYEGEVAASLIADLRANDAFVTADDLRSLPVPRPQPASCLRFRGSDVFTADRPAGGRALLHMLGLFDRLAPADFDPDGVEASTLLARVIRRTRIDRRAAMRGRAPFPLGSHESIGLAARRLGEGETSHFSVVDRWGNAVAMTQSIERSFGAKVLANGLGFLLNGYLKTFNIANPRHPYHLQPGRAARSNAAPTIAMQHDGPVAVLGSTGSERMVSSVFGVLVRLLDGDPFAAVHAPRLHATPRGEVLLEAPRVPPEARAQLERAGFVLRELEAYSFLVGGLQLVARVSPGEYVGVADPRRDGAASGPQF